MIKDIKQKVLVVDDVTKNIQLVANFLKQAGYDINYAVSGKSALSHVKKEKFDLILLDVMMPEMDGFEVCSKLKKNSESKDIPVIFLTAKTDIDSVTRGFQEGGVDYITKPFNKNELLARVRTHLELQQQKRSLKELNATKDKFFSIIAHDLKGPLNQLLGLSEILQKEMEGGKEVEVSKVAKLINESAKSGRSLLENLLEWSRSQTGTINFNPSDLKIKNVTSEVVDLFENNAIQKNIHIKSTISEEVKAIADENMVKTILRNLISNSLRFTQEGGNVTLGSTMKDEFVVVSVSDNGIGLKSADIKKLFKLDINPNSIGESKEKGTGLGLILCKEFIDIIGGEIWVESEFGKGSTFKFSMPASGS